MQVELHAPAVTLGPSYNNVQMLEDDEGLEFTVTGTSSAVTMVMVLGPSIENKASNCGQQAGLEKWY